jgi:hypothetical protein
MTVHSLSYGCIEDGGSGLGLPSPSADRSAAREAGGPRGAQRPPCQTAVFNTESAD